MTFDRKTPIFQNKSSKKTIEIGLGSIIDGSIITKGGFAFAEIVQVKGVLPTSYFTLDHFENVGVPIKVFKGVYGNSIFLKEVYKHNTVIKALDENGNILLSEREKTKNNSANRYYSRLDNVIVSYEEITNELLDRLITDMNEKESDLSISNPYILYALRGLCKKKVVKTDNGVLIVGGKHESLIVWGSSEKVAMTWFGRVLYPLGETTDLTEELALRLYESGLV